VFFVIIIVLVWSLVFFRLIFFFFFVWRLACLQLLLFFLVVWWFLVGICCYWKCCFLNGFLCVFVVIIFLVWSLVSFVGIIVFFFCRESGVLQLSTFFGSLVVLRWNLLLFYRRCCVLN